MSQKPIMVVAPHPDDETLGCGGTIARRLREGRRAVIVVLTDGANLFRYGPWKIQQHPTPPETAAMRKAETCRAVSILGGNTGDTADIRFLDFEDGALANHAAAATEALAAIIRQVDPDELYVTSQYEWHADHVAACHLARAALQQARCPATLYRYAIALPPGLTLAAIDEPRATVEIPPDLLDLKRRAVNEFRSHLQIVARGQTAPLFEDINCWLQPEETFLTDAPVPAN